MRTTAIAVVFFCACRPSTTLFLPNEKTTDADVATLARAVETVNKAAGCKMFSVGEKSIWDANVTFSTDRECKSYLDANQEDGNTNWFKLMPTTCVRSTTEIPAPTTDFYAPGVVFCDSTTGPMMAPMCFEGSLVELADAKATYIYLHEMGHMAGLNHTKNPDDIMFSIEGGTAEHGQIYNDAAVMRYVEQLRNNAGVECLK